MAQLKDTLVSGDLRVTDNILTDVIQADTINVKTSSSATTYGPGTNGQVIKSNGTYSYWDADNNVNNRKAFYGTCSTDAATAAKVVTLSNSDGWELTAGTIVGVNFTNSNTASSVTLNVNNTGAKSIYYNGAVYTGTEQLVTGFGNRIITYMYDGTNWSWISSSVAVVQSTTVTSSTNNDYRVLLSGKADGNTEIWTPKKFDGLKFNPSTGVLTSPKVNAIVEPIYTNTYTGLIGSSNDAAGASFYFGHIIPANYYNICKIHFRFTVEVAGTDTAANSCRSMHDCWVELSWNAVRTYANYNSITSTDYRPIYYINIYRANNTGIAAGCGHLIGVGLRSSWNRTTAANARTIKVEILETVNCTYTPFETALKYANVPGTGSTNYSGLTETNGYSNGLQESGDSDTIDRIRYQANIKSGSAALVAANIIVAGTDGLYKHLKTGTAFDIKYPPLYCNAALAANTAGSNNYLVIHFTITTTQSITLTAYKPIYIKGTLSGSTFTPISTTPLTQTEPTSEDGYQYMLLAISTASTTAYLTQDHRIFEYKNGAFREYNAIEGYWSASVSKAVGDTSVTISHTQITANSVIDAYTSNSSGTPISMTSIVASAGSVTITFPALTVATDFRVHIMNV